MTATYLDHIKKLFEKGLNRGRSEDDEYDGDNNNDDDDDNHEDQKYDEQYRDEAGQHQSRSKDDNDYDGDATAGNQENDKDNENGNNNTNFLIKYDQLSHHNLIQQLVAAKTLANRVESSSITSSG